MCVNVMTNKKFLKKIKLY